MSNFTACATFFVLSLASMYGVLYAFWLSFDTFPVDVRVWDPTQDKICTFPRAALTVLEQGDSTFVYLHSEATVDVTAMAANCSEFNGCTLLDTFVYLQGDKGGLCLAFETKATANGFLAAIGLKDLTEDDGTGSSASLEDSVLADSSEEFEFDIPDDDDGYDTSSTTSDSYDNVD